MGRWQPDAGGRLQRAAMELFVERGYDGTTVADIAERAGLTERTFFRHFADKREVLFAGADRLERLIVDAVAAAPGEVSPLAVVAAGLEASAPMFEERREGARARSQVIAAHPELQERELIKMASLTAALAAALRARGVGEPAASLTAEAGAAVFRVAFERWVSDPGHGPLVACLRSSMEELRAVASGG